MLGRFHQRRCLSSAARAETENLRIAIVGAGCAGLSTALNLAPLVSKGLIERIDIHEKLSKEDHSQIGKDLGIGLWSTALSSFMSSDCKRKSYSDLCDSLIFEHGSWAKDVGYRTPKGNWLAKSTLSQFYDERNPGLLFINEKRFFSELKRAVQYEEQHCNTIRMSYGSDNNSVIGVLSHYEKNSHSNDSKDAAGSGRLVFENGSVSSKLYHCIIDTTGMNSVLRSRYGVDYHAPIEKISEDPGSQSSSLCVEDRGYVVFRGVSSDLDESERVSFQTWGENESMRFATVPMKKGQAWFATTSDPKIMSIMNDQNNNSNSICPEVRKQFILDAFKDWHEPILPLIQSTPCENILMERAFAHRYSVKPVLSLHNHDYSESGNTNNNKAKKSVHEQLTPLYGDRGFIGESTAERYRRQRLDDEVIGVGPILLFCGDSAMTVDPVLAQGFTMAMESGALLSKAIEQSCIQLKADLSSAKKDNDEDSTGDKNNSNANSATCMVSLQSSYSKHLISQSFSTSSSANMPKQLGFSPRMLRKNLSVMYRDFYEPRLLCLLRTSELVQALAQPRSHSILGTLSINVLRPIMQYSPQLLIRPIFDFMARYSLGMVGRSESFKGKKR